MRADSFRMWEVCQQPLGRRGGGGGGDGKWEKGVGLDAGIEMGGGSKSEWCVRDEHHPV